MLSLPRNQFRFGLKVLLGLALSLTMLISLASPAPSQPAIAGSPELRGVWLTTVDSDVLFSRDRLQPALQKLASLHFNTVYPAVWNWGYTLYPSQTAETAIGYAVDPRVPNLQDWDALANVVELGHQQGLSVMPWFEFGFMTTAESEIVNTHPKWITERSDGSQIWQDGRYQRRWLNPFKPEVQQFIQSMILEIVTHYDIDGIQFDDHFGLPAEFGYDEFTVRLYQQEHGGQSPPLNPDNPEWVRWRANKITRFMTQIFRAVKARKPGVVISLAPNNYPFSYHHYLQDWQAWEQQGLIEELILQVYSGNLDNFIADLSRPEVRIAKQHIPVSVGILTGLKDLFVPIHQVEEQVWAVRDRNFSGVSFFFYETLWNLTGTERDAQVDGKAERQAVFSRLFNASASIPNLMDNWVPPD
ncbi:MAG: family 10 glycosylhydrolase [Leptolyngbyaceae cyanobacterium CRU_2_3]|nr:family 10 glycosylhydrolase [Leptolyngbyaceae cyanobacterium CRU_2_3]